MKCWQLIEAVPVRSFNTDHTDKDEKLHVHQLLEKLGEHTGKRLTKAYVETLRASPADTKAARALEKAATADSSSSSIKSLSGGYLYSTMRKREIKDRLLSQNPDTTKAVINKEISIEWKAMGAGDVDHGRLTAAAAESKTYREAATTAMAFNNTEADSLVGRAVKVPAAGSELDAYGAVTARLRIARGPADSQQPDLFGPDTDSYTVRLGTDTKTLTSLELHGVLLHEADKVLLSKTTAYTEMLLGQRDGSDLIGSAIRKFFDKGGWVEGQIIAFEPAVFASAAAEPSPPAEPAKQPAKRLQRPRRQGMDISDTETVDDSVALWKVRYQDNFEEDFDALEMEAILQTVDSRLQLRETHAYRVLRCPAAKEPKKKKKNPTKNSAASAASTAASSGATAAGRQ